MSFVNMHCALQCILHKCPFIGHPETGKITLRDRCQIWAGEIFQSVYLCSEICIWEANHQALYDQRMQLIIVLHLIISQMSELFFAKYIYKP